MRNETEAPPVLVRAFPQALEAQTLRRRSSTQPRGPAAPRPDEAARVAASRARHVVLRYVVHNRLAGFVTLTSANRCTPRRLADHVRRLLARRRTAAGRFPWLWVPEDRPRPHVHLFAPEEAAAALAADWRYGHFDLQSLAGVDGLRAASLYVSKTFGASTDGRRRYHRARGFAPESVVLEVPSLLDLSPLEPLMGTGAVEPFPIPSNPHRPFVLPTIRFAPSNTTSVPPNPTITEVDRHHD